MSRTPAVQSLNQNSRAYIRPCISRDAWKQLKLVAMQYDLTPTQVLEKIIADESRMARVREWAEKVKRGELLAE